MREEDLGDISGTEWRWNQVMESKILKTRGAFIQVIDPVVLTETIGEPIYSFRSADLQALGALILGSISLEDRARLPLLRKWTSHFPYRSGGKISVFLQYFLLRLIPKIMRHSSVNLKTTDEMLMV